MNGRTTRALFVVMSVLLGIPAGPAGAGFTPSGSFATVRPDEVVHLIHPAWDPGTKRTGRGDEMADIDDARTWRDHGRERLLVLVGVWSDSADDRWMMAANGSLFCDLIILDREGGRLAVIGRATKAAACGGATAARLDLAPYAMDSRTTLIGVRSKSMNHGWGKEELTLFRLAGRDLSPVFRRTMGTSNGNTEGVEETKAILKVEPTGTGPSAFVVEERGPASQSVERWTWNGTQYVKGAVSAGGQSATHISEKGPVIAQGGGITITADELKARLDEQSPKIRASINSLERKKQFLDNLLRFELLAKAAEKEGLASDPDVRSAAKKFMASKDGRASDRDVQFTMKKVMVSKYYQRFFQEGAAKSVPNADARLNSQRRSKEFDDFVKKLRDDAHIQVNDAELEKIAIVTE